MGIRIFAITVFVSVLLVNLCSAAGNDPEIAEDDDIALAAEVFLDAVRAPFQREAWVRLDGRAVKLDAKGVTKADLHTSILYTPEALQAQLRLNDTSRYLIRQEYRNATNEQPVIKLDEFEGENSSGPSLFDFGITSADVTMSFLYWDLLQEHPPESLGRFECRVMDLDHPHEPVFVRVWFARKYRFPLKVLWFNDDGAEPWRELEFKGFKRHNELWFVKEMHLRGTDWKTQVKFDDVEMYLTADKPVPADFPVQP